MTKMIFYGIFSVCFIFSSLNVYASTIIIPHTISGFGSAKKLMKRIYYDHQFDYYCGCDYAYLQVNGRERTVVNPVACGYAARKNPERGKYIEWEHVVPAFAFGSTRKCWREEMCADSKGKKFKGRKCCEKTDPIFRAMESDLHNLRPAVGELNADRSNYSYNVFDGFEGLYGACDFKVGGRVVQPRPEIRGDIARTYFYMEKTYLVHISDRQRRLFEAWDKMYPPTPWERIRNERIAVIQGNRNPFIR